MKNSNGASYGADILGAVFTAIQTDITLQIISLVLTIVATVFSIAFTIYKWYKSAKADGKITKDEIDELIDELNRKDMK